VLFLAACRTDRATRSADDFFVGALGGADPASSIEIAFGQKVAGALAVEVRGARSFGSGELFQAQAGARQTWSTGRARRPYVRVGLTWVRTTEDRSSFDGPGDYLGAFTGGGYEWDVVPGLSLGPEVTLSVLEGEGSLGFAFLVRFGIQLRFRF